MTKIFTSLVGRRCRAAQEFRAVRQLCPTTMGKVLVLRPIGQNGRELRFTTASTTDTLR